MQKIPKAADIDYVHLWAQGLIAHNVSFLSDVTENNKCDKKEKII